MFGHMNAESKSRCQGPAPLAPTSPHHQRGDDVGEDRDRYWNPAAVVDRETALGHRISVGQPATIWTLSTPPVSSRSHGSPRISMADGDVNVHPPASPLGSTKASR